METDLCTCGIIRAAHLIVPTAEAVACLNFVIDRKATWHAERGQPKPRGRRVLAISICGVCKSPRGPFERVGKNMVHVGCPGPKTPMPRPGATSFKMPSSR